MSELKKAMVNTGIDKFLELISARKSISLKEASKILSFPLETLESWSSILSKEKVISIDYDSFGNMIVFITHENVEAKTNKINSLKSTIEDKTKVVEENIVLKEKDLKRELKELKDLEEELKKEIGYTKELTVEFEKVANIEEELSKKMAVLEQNKNDLSKYTKSVTKEIDLKLKGVQDVEKEINKYEDKKNDIKKDILFIKKLSYTIKNEAPEDIEKKINELEKRQENLLKENKKLNSNYSLIHKILSKMK